MINYQFGNFNNKKGISPVVATVLLVITAIVVVAIIYVWASNSIGESESKFGVPLDQACETLNVDASVSGANINIVNRESQFALQGITIKDSSGDLHPCSSSEFPLPPGESITIPLNSCDGAGSITPESVIPILKGESGTEFSCDKNEI